MIIISGKNLRKLENQIEIIALNQRNIAESGHELAQESVITRLCTMFSAAVALAFAIRFMTRNW